MRVSRQGRVEPAEIAHDASYGDLSHMRRNVRRQTGLSPMQLMRRIEIDEAYWCYRLIGGLEKS